MTLQTSRALSVAAPNLPLAPQGYERQYQDQFANVLRLFFNELTNTINLVVGNEGGQYLSFPYGAFNSSVTQTAVATNTPYAVTFDTTTISNSVVVDHTGDESQVVVDEPGIYNFAFSLQLSSSAATPKNIWIWAAVDGVNVENSATRVIVSGSNAEDVAAWNFFLEMQAGQYFQLMWAVDHVGVEILAEAATAFAPAIPSAILTVNFVSALPVSA